MSEINLRSPEIGFEVDDQEKSPVVEERRVHQLVDVLERRGAWIDLHEVNGSQPDSSPVDPRNLILSRKTADDDVIKVVDLSTDSMTRVPTSSIRAKLASLGIDVDMRDIVFIDGNFPHVNGNSVVRDLSIPGDEGRFLTVLRDTAGKILVDIRRSLEGVNTFSGHDNLDFADLPHEYDYIDNEKAFLEHLFRRLEEFGDQDLIIPIGGFSGSGKSTVLRMTKEAMSSVGRKSFLLDGDSHLCLERDSKLKTLFTKLHKLPFGHRYHDVYFQDLLQVARVIEKWASRAPNETQVPVDRLYRRNKGGIIEPGIINIPSGVNTLFIDATLALEMARSFQAISENSGICVLPILKVPENSFPSKDKCVAGALKRANLRDLARYGSEVADQRIMDRSNEYPHQAASILPTFAHFVEKGMTDRRLRPIVYSD